MIKSNLTRTVYLVLLLITCSAGQVLAQIPVRTGPAPADEIKKARLALDTNMNNMAAHKTYIYAMGINTQQVVDQYREWMKKYPENVTVPLSIGTVYYNAEMPQSGEFLLRVAAMEPGNAKIWSMLAGDAFTRGEKDLSTEYLRKATLADPSNANYAVSYLRSFEDGDPDAYKQKVFDFLKRFPENEAGAMALWELGERAVNRTDKINYFEELRKLYPPQKFNWSASGMVGLADIYLQTAPEKALALINEMGDEKNWKMRKQAAESLIQINKLEQNQNYKEALIELDQVKLPRFNYMNDFIILKKAALLEKSGNVKTAYDSLAIRFAKSPTDEIHNLLALYGNKIGKDKEHIMKDIETMRNSTAVAAYPFDLGLYTSNGKLNLKDLKGKVVLLTFWFPACSPCRAEFPHFEAVLNKFKGDNVVYVGIDVSPLQDGYVIPLLKNGKYSFIPLRGNSDFAAKNYGVQGEPENFLIDKDGKIVFSGFRIDSTNHHTLELMIASLLQKGGKSN
ncbi:TlpA disulfide reductase family protein [Mucilaginibacter sp. OK098]|uniref:TlpA disulfide reductase family protein n=1 Tax=Mucilaginibacter sp. OK098 TaxID=1855297 RepID=UPI000911E32A|nr:TlpA disulfide reductase family protein [Mucilaginibacter sp. OK098]SHN31698.1 Peroxiredoxin [Mucilaginibacter sp. OK098]